MSVKEEVVELLFKRDLIRWILSLLEKSTKVNNSEGTRSGVTTPSMTINKE